MMPTDAMRPAVTVGILYPGELGCALGKMLAAQGCRVVTTLEGRSTRTRRLSSEAGFESLGSLQAVAEAADVVVSVVPPAAALSVARQYCDCNPLAPPLRLYVDMNSVSPDTMATVAAVLAESGVECLDGAVHGLAAKLGSRGTVYLSGKSAERIAALLDSQVNVRIVGPQIGRASAMKMLISGLPKGIAALFFELTIAARKAGLLDELLSCYRQAYPGVMEIMDRLLPTYPQHAGRRVGELIEVEKMFSALGMQPYMANAAHSLIAEMACLELTRQRPADSPQSWSLREVIEAADDRGLCRGNSSADPPHPLGAFT